MAEKENGSGGKAAAEEEFIPVGPGADPDEEIHSESDEEPRAARGEETEEDGDERVGRNDDEGEDEDRSNIRAKRRREKQRRKERYQNDRQELNFLRQRNEQLERFQSEVSTRFDQVDINQVDTRVGQLDEQIAEAERIHAEAITKANGAAATEALQIRDTLRDEKSKLLGFRQHKVGQARQQKNPAVDPAVRRQAENWLEENGDWFDPQLRDEDSRIAKTIEDGLYQEGRLDARTPEYWEEYNRRLAKRGIGPSEGRRGRQERDRDDEDEDEEPEDRPQERRRPKGPRITTGGRERPIKKGEVHISAERRKAMEDAGVWENPTLRNKYLRQYANYDRDHRGDRNRR